jgi:hypothetical protein
VKRSKRRRGVRREGFYPWIVSPVSGLDSCNKVFTTINCSSQLFRVTSERVCGGGGGGRMTISYRQVWTGKFNQPDEKPFN